jgi:hypothetical protein
MLFSIQAVNISQSLALFATTQPQVTSNLRNLMRRPILSSRETRLPRGARPKLTICTNLIAIRFSARHLPSSHMVQRSCKVSSGRITHVFSHSRPQEPIWQPSLKRTNALFSNSWPFTNLKASAKSQTVFWDSLHTKM